MGYKEINNPCDLIVFKQGVYPHIRPVLNLFECKAIHGNTLNFKSNIRENQWQKLLEYSQITGINAGVICWFIDHDVTVYLSIEYLQELKESGYKSFNINKDGYDYKLLGKKKKVFFEYDLEKFLEDMSYE